jgi:hypothetical protein
VVLFAFNNLMTGSKLRTVGRGAAVVLVFASLLVCTVGMHNWESVGEEELSFAGRKHFSLVISAHLNCPGSRGTIAEAVRICYRVPEEVKVIALVVSEGDEKIEVSTFPELSGLAKVKARILSDRNGERARALGITNLAQALLFSPNGKHLYDGSITAAPGRRENSGEERVVQIINGSGAIALPSEPQGCPIEGSFCAHEHGLKTAENL